MLSERVEALTGPYMEVFVEAYEAVYPNYATNVTSWASDTCHAARYEFLVCKEAWLEASMMLMPDGWWLQHLGQCLGGWRVRIETNGPPSKSIGIGFGVEQPATPALALTAAALKAHGL